jgi:hypothetical protein
VREVSQLCTESGGVDRRRIFFVASTRLEVPLVQRVVLTCWSYVLLIGDIVTDICRK